MAGVAVAHVLQRRIRGGAARKIAEKIEHMDESLGLHGEEKTLSNLIDNR